MDVLAMVREYVSAKPNDPAVRRFVTAMRRARNWGGRSWR